MKTNGVIMFGYDISDHEALKKGIVHAGGGVNGLKVTLMMMKVSEM